MKDLLYINWERCMEKLRQTQESLKDPARWVKTRAYYQHLVQTGYKLTWGNIRKTCDTIAPPDLRGKTYIGTEHTLFVPDVLPQGRTQDSRVQNWLSSPAWQSNLELKNLVGECVGQVCNNHNLPYVPDYRKTVRIAIFTDCTGRTVYANKRWDFPDRQTFVSRSCGGDRISFIIDGGNVKPFLSDSSYSFTYPLMDFVRRLVFYETPTSPY